jgi:2-oxoisovalerate dehydrogenase E2 component (dihydrolipoyl transacylase)
MEIVLPQLGESITEGIIGKWLVVEGDEIDKYQPLLEVITDKVNVEMPAPVSGIITKIVAAEGETVLVGAVIALIETSGQADIEILETPEVDTIGGFVSGIPAVGPTGAANVPQHNSHEVGNVGNISNFGLSPAVKKLVEKHNINLSELHGTGRSGRVTRKDVEAFLNIEATIPKDSVNHEIGHQTMDPIRKTIAQNMTQSSADIPDVWLSIETDVTNLVILRESIKDKFLEANGFPITFLAFAVLSVAKGVKEHPIVNSSIEKDEIIAHTGLNMGIAVASSVGLIVPVIKDVFDKSLTSIAAEIYRLVTLANSGNLAHSDVTHGTFTINNTGTLGSNLSKPIIVPGQASIMTTEKINKKPVVMPVDSKKTDLQVQINKQEAIEIRSIMNLCLSFDHRIMDGSHAAGFLNRVKTSMESFGKDTALD